MSAEPSARRLSTSMPQCLFCKARSTASAGSRPNADTTKGGPEDPPLPHSPDRALWIVGTGHVVHRARRRLGLLLVHIGAIPAATIGRRVVIGRSRIIGVTAIARIGVPVVTIVSRPISRIGGSRANQRAGAETDSCSRPTAAVMMVPRGLARGRHRHSQGTRDRRCRRQFREHVHRETPFPPSKEMFRTVVSFDALIPTRNEPAAARSHGKHGNRTARSWQRT